MRVARAVITRDDYVLPGLVGRPDPGRDRSGCFGGDGRRLQVMNLQLNHARNESRLGPVAPPPLVQLPRTMVAIAGGQYVGWGV